MFNKAEELLQQCERDNKLISQIVIKKEMECEEITYSNLMKKMNETLDIMKKSASSALSKEITSVSGLTGGDSKKVEDYKNSGKSISGSLVASAMAKALSTSEVNASMGKIIAAPTAGASGILPASLIAASDKLNATDDMMISALFTAAGIGEIIVKNATVSGAEGGCQAECGVASAMGAAAIVEMAGGSPEKSLHAASFALISVMGLVCDPIAGLVEYPCALRNASGVVNALTSADLALAGVKSLVPFDEVVDAMYEVGKALPDSLKETALGGLAATPTGQCINRRINIDKK